ncbi:3-oxoacyl-ACP reductase family protein [Haloarculaceae archaeon H-GB11]|nr:3-oxoacyl-ACP reductase family protein [Haloarculaceae archaeon H-GB11]
MELEGRAAIVTGGSSGIGRAIALAFAREGADVAVGDVRETPKDVGESASTAERVRELGGEAVFCETDITDPEQVTDLVDAAVDAFGGLDVLVNNAGISRDGTVHETSEDDWNDIVDVNLSGAYRCAKTAMPHLLESDHGRVINVASQMGFVGMPESAAYCATKGGMVNLTRQMAVDYSGEGVTVNGICPGPIKTSMSRDGSADDPKAWYEDEEELAHYEEQVLTPKIGEPEDVGRAAVFIASDGARFMTGHNLVIDGGYVAK